MEGAQIEFANSSKWQLRGGSVSLIDCFAVRTESLPFYSAVSLFFRAVSEEREPLSLLRVVDDDDIMVLLLRPRVPRRKLGEAKYLHFHAAAAAAGLFPLNAHLALGPVLM